MSLMWMKLVCTVSNSRESWKQGHETPTETGLKFRAIKLMHTRALALIAETPHQAHVLPDCHRRPPGPVGPPSLS
jgi:hypothetical protein